MVCRWDFPSKFPIQLLPVKLSTISFTQVYKLGDNLARFINTQRWYMVGINDIIHFSLKFCDTGDAMSFHSGLLFTTKDRDNDHCTYGQCAVGGETNCARIYHAGWWFRACLASNLNGRYQDGITTRYAAGLVWATWTGFDSSLKTSEMKLRPAETSLV